METTGVAAARVAVSLIGFLCKIATGARALLVDSAADIDTNGSPECGTAPRVMVSTAHVRASTEDRIIIGERSWYPSPGFGIELLA